MTPLRIYDIILTNILRNKSVHYVIIFVNKFVLFDSLSTIYKWFL